MFVVNDRSAVPSWVSRRQREKQRNMTLSRPSQAKVPLLLAITALSTFLSGLIIRVCPSLSYR